MAEGVRADVFPNACGHNASLQHGEGHLARHFSALPSQKERVLVALERNDVGAVVAEVVVDGIARLLTDGNNAFLVAFPNHPNQSVNQVHLGQLEINELSHAQPTTVEHFEHGLVAHAFPSAHVHGSDDAFDFCHSKDVGQLSFGTRCFDELNGVGVHDSLNPEVLAKAAHPTEHACLTVSGETPVVQMT